MFKKYQFNTDKLIEHGFIKDTNKYIYKTEFMENQFIAIVEVYFDGNVEYSVFDKENNEEYLPIKIKGAHGAFVGEVRQNLEIILKDIRKKCCSNKYFILPQSNRITEYILDTYGDKPEFLWEKFDDTGIFRNKKTEKWYGIIMDVDKSKLIPDKKGKIEVLNIKLKPEKVEELVKIEGYYPAYHMNKKHWISIILDDSLSDKKITELISESYSLNDKTK